MHRIVVHQHFICNVEHSRIQGKGSINLPHSSGSICLRLNVPKDYATDIVQHLCTVLVLRMAHRK